MRTDTKASRFIANDFEFVREFYCVQHLQEFIIRTNRWKIIYDARTRYGHKSILQCAI